MGIVDKFLTNLGYTKSISVESNPFLAEFLNGVEGSQVSKPYANVPAVYKAVKAIIDNASNVDKHLVNADGEEVATNQEILDLLDNVVDQSGQKLSFAEFIQKVTGYYALYGEFYLVKLVETEGQLRGTQLPKGLMVVNPKDVMPLTNGKLLTGWSICSKNFMLEEVIQVKDFNPYSDIRGLSPIDVVMDELRIETGASEHIWSLFANGATPGMIIETEKELTPEQQRQFRQAWESRHRGAKKSGKMALLTGGASAKQFGMSNVDMQLSELIAKSEEKIIGLWRVPKAMFGYTDNLNRATFLGQLNVFYSMTIIPMLNKIEESLNKEIVKKYKSQVRFAFDYSNVEALQSQISDKIDTAVKLQQLGFTRNEINEKLDLGFDVNTEWGDTYFIQFSQVPAGGMSIADQEPTKTLKKKSTETVEVNGLTYGLKQYEHIKSFIKLHDQLHKGFTKDVKGYFNGLRKRVLDSVDDSYKGFADIVNKQVQVNIDWQKEAEMFGEAIEQYEALAMEQGIKQGERVTGINATRRAEIMATEATRQRLTFVSDEVSATNQKQVNEVINQVINDGGTVDDIKRGIKDYFNKTSNRAEVIARTEITAQLNGGLLLQYDDAGIKQKEWVTTIDEFTREAHLMMNGEIVNVDAPFSNGLMMPAGAGDDLGQSINCRCSCFPVIDND